MTRDEMHAEFKRLSGLLDDALRYAGDQVKAYAQAESDYRRAKSAAFVQRKEGLAAERVAWVEAACADERRTRDVAEGMKQVGLEAIRSRRGQLSALQSLAALHRSEMELAR